MNTTFTLEQIPESPESNLSTNQLLIMANEAITQLEMAGEDFRCLKQGFINKDDGGNPHAGEVINRAPQCYGDVVRSKQVGNCNELAEKLATCIQTILDGKFSDKCTSCGNPIPQERLEAELGTHRCAPCKTKEAELQDS